MTKKDEDDKTTVRARLKDSKFSLYYEVLPHMCLHDSIVVITIVECAVVLE